MSRRRNPLWSVPLVPALLAAQQAPHAGLEAARAAWHAGDYPAALQTLIELRTGADGDALHREIALLTGELHPVREVAADARSPALCLDGRFAGYELPRDRRSEAPPVSRIVALEGAARTVAEVEGSDCTFAADGSLALLIAPDRTALIAVRLPDGQRTELRSDGRRFVAARAAGDRVFALASAEGAARTELLGFARNGDGFGPPHEIDAGPGFKADLQLASGGTHAICRRVATDPLAPRRRGRPRAPRGPERFVVVDCGGGAGGHREYEGSLPVTARRAPVVAFSAPGGDGSEDDTEVLCTLSLPGSAGELPTPREVHRQRGPVAGLALSPGGGSLAFMARPGHDWELFVVATDGDAGADGEGGARRLTHEIQDDLEPAFLDEATLMAVIGEPRHRRAHVHDLATGARMRLFHNNTVRTIAPQYDWQASADGRLVLILAERDGDTVSPDRSLHLVDRGAEIGREDLLARLQRQLAGERALRDLAERTFAPIDAEVTAATDGVSVERLRGYQEQLAGCGSRHITQPGNAQARDLLAGLFRSFGYEPEIQKLASRGERRSPLGAGGSSNVIARLEGTVHPELCYVLGSHYDSVARGPGADDNGSGTAVTLEAARVLADRPLPATVLFVLFTGEESGLLGSREFVRVAAEKGLRVVGALNNDMLGWAGEGRRDNTIRYSNKGIRDVQHGAALRYSDLITYDACYYKGTDAAAFFEAWGDVVGGIGSYPVLGNPHYHEASDVLATIDHEQVAATAKTTVASLMLLASSPSRIEGLRAGRTAEGLVRATWTPSPERDVRGYEVVWGPAGGPVRESLRTAEPAIALEGAGEAVHVAVRAFNVRGLRGWDWARAEVR